MAVVDSISIPVTCEGGPTKRSVVFFPTGLAVADLQGFWTAFAPEFDTMHSGVTGLPTAKFTMTNPGGLRANPVADSDSRRGCLMSFDAAATNYSWGFFLPGVNPSVIVGGVINEADASLIAVRDRLLTGEAGPPARLPADRFGNDLTGFLGAVLSFRK